METGNGMMPNHMTSKRNGLFDSIEPYTDSNLNGQWDPADTYSDLNNNGQLDSAEYFEDRSYDFYDENDEWIYIPENGKWDDAEPLINDYDGDGRWDNAENFSDTHGNESFVLGEPLSDEYLNGQWTPLTPILI